MEFIKRDFDILKWIIKDEFNHEFHPLMIEIQNKLNIKVSKFSLFIILLVYQYAFMFLLLLLFYNMRNSSLFLLVFFLVALFNIILPATIARTSRTRIEENPIFECLAMSELPLNKCKKIIIISELANFWIHNFSIELLTIWLFFVKFKVLGLLLGLFWIVIVSAIFLRILMKRSDINSLNVDSLSTYLFNLILGGFISFNIFEIFVGTLKKISLDEFFNANELSNYAKGYLQNIVEVFKVKINYFIIILLLFLLVFGIIKFVINKIEFSKINQMKNIIVKKYLNLLLYFTNNFFVRRDLKRIFNIMPKLEINIFTIIIPSGIVFLGIAYMFFIVNQGEVYAVLIALDFIFWAAIYQFSNLIVQKIPIFNISSELRNIEIVKMSNISIQKLIDSKHVLLGIFNIPLLLMIIIEKMTLLCLNLNPIILAISLINNIGMLIISLLLTLKWTLVLPNFSWANMFMIKQDNFDTQILQQFLVVPSRIITLYFVISFVFVNIVNVNYNISFVFLYYVLSAIGIGIMILLLKRSRGNEHNVKV